MENQNVESLKRRTLADAVVSIVIAIGALCISVAEFLAYTKAGGAVPQYMVNGIYAGAVFVVLIIVSMILAEIRKTGKPFSKSIIWKLRVLAVWIMASSLSAMVFPVLAASPGRTLVFAFEAENVFGVLLGVVVGILSEIFVYGYGLQEDMDSIA